jgi:hypothetical protein
LLNMMVVGARNMKRPGGSPPITTLGLADGSHRQPLFRF